MQLTQAPLRLHPHHCVVTGREDGEIIDFEATPACDVPPAIYLKREVVEEAAEKLCGMVKRSKFEALEARMVSLSEELDRVNRLYIAEQEVSKVKEELEGPLPDKEAINA